MNETLNDFVTGNDTDGSAIGIESLQPQTNGLSCNFGRITAGENSACQDRAVEKKIDEKIRKAVDNALLTFKNRNAILKAMDNIVIPRVETAVRLITGLSGRGFCSMIQNRDQRDFTENTESTLLMSASSRKDLNVDQDKNDEKCNVGNFDAGHFPALRPDFDRNAHAHHNYFKSFYHF